MMECYNCKKRKLKLKNATPAFIDGKSVFLCRECADKILKAPRDVKRVELK